MSFIIKKFLRRIIEQYLNIYDQLNLQKGQLQLPSGHLNHTNLNKILRSKNMPIMVAYSEYVGLGISVPVIEILSKPIVVKMECLRVVVVVETDGEVWGGDGVGDGGIGLEELLEETGKEESNEGEEKIRKDKNKDKTSKNKDPIQGSMDQKSQKSYLKSIITRLLTNIEIQIKKLQITVRLSNKETSASSQSQSQHQQLDNNEYKLTLQNFMAKNSLSLLQANILKKIICMSRFSVTVNHIAPQSDIKIKKQQQVEQDSNSDRFRMIIAEVTDLNMCLNIDYTRVTMICLLDRFQIGLDVRIASWVIGKVKAQYKRRQKYNKEKKPQQKEKISKPMEEPKNSLKPDVEAMQIKINQIKVSLIERSSIADCIQLYKLTILHLEVNKQKTKSMTQAPTSMLKKPTVPKTSNLTIQLQSVALSLANQDKSSKMQPVLLIKMSQKGNNYNQNSTIQGWNKKKRKQFRIEINLIDGRVCGVGVCDVEVGIWATEGIVENGRIVVGVVGRYLTEFMAGRDNVIERKTDKRSEKKQKQMEQVLPQISLTNLKLSLTVQPSPKSPHHTLSLLLPSVTKFLAEQARKTLQISTLLLIVDCHYQLLKINSIKLSQECQKIKSKEEIVVSVHEVRGDFDVGVVSGLRMWATAHQFGGLVNGGKRLGEEVMQVVGVLEARKEAKSVEKVQRMIREDQTPEIQQQKQTPGHQPKTSLNLFLRINQILLCLGSHTKVPVKFNPVFLFELQSVKCLYAHKALHSSSTKMSIKFTMKSLCAISPHNLSYSSLLRGAIRVKVYRNGEKDQKMGTDKNMENVNNVGITLLDPLTIDIQQQHLMLLTNIISNLTKSQSDFQKPTIFTTVRNITNQPIVIQQRVTKISSTKSTQSDRNSATMTMDMSEGLNSKSTKQKQKQNYQNGNIMLDGYCQLTPNQQKQIYLLDMIVRVRINGELSEPILLALDDTGSGGGGATGDIGSLTSIDEEPEDGLAGKSGVRVNKSASLNLQNQNAGMISVQGQQSDYISRRKTLQIPSDKSLKPPSSPTPTPIPCPILHPCHKIQKPIMFPYHEQCRYMLQIDYSQGFLFLSVKYKYQLHIMEGIEGGCGLGGLEVRCIKFDKYERYVSKEGKGGVLRLDWELLEEDKYQHVTILMETQQVQEYRLFRLMTNSLKYKLYGLYPSSTSTPATQTPQHFHYYLLQQTPSPSSSSSTLLPSSLHPNPHSHHYHLLPFLILRNSMQNNPISLTITNKKSLQSEQYGLGEGVTLVPVHMGFDYYMKQYMIRFMMEDYVCGVGGGRELVMFQSEEHYFNTFFMVDEGFENVIQLRNQKTNARRYIRVRQSFVHKTKILQISPSLHIENKTPHILQLSIIPRGVNANNNGLYLLERDSTYDYPNKVKKDDRLRVTYVLGDLRENSIEVPVGGIVDNGGRVLLSYNFCRLDTGDNKNSEQYYQILIKLQLKTISHLHHGENLAYNPSNMQVQLIFTPFLTFTNLCSKGRRIQFNGTILESCYSGNGNGDKRGQGSISLCLPSNTNKDYNNKYMGINVEQIYDDLLINNKNWIMEGSRNYMQIQLLPLPVPHSSKPSSTPSTTTPSIVYLHQLITHKILEHNKSVYSLVKSLKDDKIQLYFSDHLLNINGAYKYYIFNNSTQHYFLMNSTDTEYAKYLLFPNKWDEEQMGASKNMFKKEDKRILQATTTQPKHQQKPRQPSQPQQQPSTPPKKQPHSYNYQTQNHPISKVQIEGNNPYPVNIMLNKQKYDIFLCDSEYRKLEPLTFRKIEKLKIQHEKYQIENFMVMDLEAGGAGGQFQFGTNMVNIRVESRSKNVSLMCEIKSINVRNFDNDKIDILVQDVNVYVTAVQNDVQGDSSDQIKQQPPSPNTSTTSPPTTSPNPASNRKKTKLQTYQILRIPQQSYLLVEQKIYENKFILIKNIYIKCKIIDLHVNKQILGFVMHFNKIAGYLGTFLQESRQQGKEKAKESVMTSSRGEMSKILHLCQQKILLIRSLCIHPINLCLSVQTTPNMDFSNMITIPEFALSNKVLRVTNISKQILNHYATNVIGKFPKLSFIYQNLRSPLAMVKSILEARTMLVGGGERDREGVLWRVANVGFDRKYLGVAAARSLERCLGGLIGINNRKSNDRQLERVHQFLLQLTLLSTSPSAEQFLYPLKNIISSNVTKLSQTNIPLSYYLGSKSVHIISTTPTPIHEQIPIKEIESIKMTKYYNSSSGGGSGNGGNAELMVGFRRKGVYLRIVDDVGVCLEILRCVNEVIM